MPEGFVHTAHHMNITNKKMDSIVFDAHTEGYDYIPDRFLSDKPKWNNILHEQQNRQMTVKNMCHGLESKKYLSVIMPQRISQRLKVDDVRNVMYCLTPKSGSTNFLRMLVNLNTHGQNPVAVNGRMHSDKHLLRYGLKALSLMTLEERVQRLSNFSRLLMVRHPLTRWLSAFRQKMKLKAYMSVRQKIVRDYRPDASQEDIEKGNPTFEEFLKHLITVGLKNATYDHHWAPYTYLCDPCRMHYDYIIKLETLSDDLVFLREVLYDNSTDVVIPNKYNGFTEGNVIMEFYSNVSMGTLHRVVDIYRRDFEMFGYTPKIGDIVL